MSAAFIVLLVLQAAAAQRPPPSTTDMPGWSRTPTADEMAAAYPAEALAANFAGAATLECSVGAAGGLEDCATVSEAGPGFGAAALSVAGRFQMPTKAPSGRPGGAISFDRRGRAGPLSLCSDRRLHAGPVRVASGHRACSGATADPARRARRRHPL
jgi:hypothetical protein